MKIYFKRFLYLIFLPLLITAIFQGCYDSDNVLKTDIGTGKLSEKMIMTYLNKYPDKYSVFVEILNKTNMQGLLKAYGKYTCFVPTDSAMKVYFKQQKGDTATIKSFTTAELRKFIFMHMIDGEAQSNKITYNSDNFVEGELGATNMFGRTLLVSYQNLSKTGFITINKTSNIIQKDSVCKNGVVHTIDKVLEPVDFLLPEAIKNDANLSIFAKALYATGLSDSISKTTDGITYTDPVTATNTFSKIFAYTVFAEPDNVLKSYGIDSYETLKAMYDDGVGTSIKDPANGLYRFVAYHIMPVKKVLEELYPEPMMTLCPNTLLDFDLQNESLKYPADPYNNYTKCWNYWKAFASNTFVLNRGTTTANTPGYIEFDYQNKDNLAINGVYHYLKQLLDVKEHGENGPIRLQKRLRFDVWSFVPEVTNNRMRKYSNKADYRTYFPQGYLSNISFTESTQLDYEYFERYIWLYCDFLMVNGWYDFTITTPPIPAGTWEIRYEWNVNNSGVVLSQVYFDDEIQGVPYINKQGCAINNYGWKQDMTTLAGNDDQIAQNDREMRNLGMLKASLSAISQYYNAGRYDVSFLRKIVCTKTFNTMGRHKIRVKGLASATMGMDFIEFVPVDKIATEDRW